MVEVAMVKELAPSIGNNFTKTCYVHGSFRTSQHVSVTIIIVISRGCYAIHPDTGESEWTFVLHHRPATLFNPCVTALCGDIHVNLTLIPSVYYQILL